MDPVNAASSSPTGATDPASATTAADFQAAYDQVLGAVGAAALSVVLEELIQIGSSEE
jgi:hypothetical protein